MGVYKDGYITVKIGSATVLGHSTEWISNMEENFMRISDSSFYTIDSVVSATQLTITPVYKDAQYSTGSNVKGLRYYIVRDYTDNFGFPEITNDSEDVAGIYTHGIRMVDEQFTYVNEDFTVIDGGLLIGTGNGWSPYDFTGNIGIVDGNASNVDDDGNVPAVDDGNDNTGEDDDGNSASDLGGIPTDPEGTIPTDNWEESLVLWLKMDEISGDTMADSSANNITASILGYDDDSCWVGTNTRLGHNGKGWSPRNAVGAILAGDGYESTFQDSFTAMGWISTKGTGSSANPQYLFGVRDATSNNLVSLGLGVWTNPAAGNLSQIQFTWRGSGGDFINYNTGNIFLDGYYSPLVHLAVSVTANADIKLYMNGVELDAPSIHDDFVGIDMSDYTQPTLRLAIGGYDWNGMSSNYFLRPGAQMVDFRLYDTALTVSQIRAIATQDELSYKRLKQYMSHSRGINDGEYYKLSPTIYNTNTYVRWGKYFDIYSLWSNVDLPSTPQLRDAAIMYKAIYETGLDVVYSYISADNVNNATTINSVADAQSVSFVASQVGWHLKGPAYDTWDNGDEITTPNLVSVVEQVTHRSGWTKGNNLLMYTESVTASSINYQRTFRAFEYSTVTNTATYNSQKLYINYAVATTAIVPGVATLSNTYLIYPMNENTGQIITNNGYSGYTGNLLNVTASPLRDNWASGIDDGYAVVFNATMETHIDANDSGAFSDELYNGPFTICNWIDQDDGATSCAYGGALGWMAAVGGAKGHRPGFVYGNNAGKLYVDYKLTSSTLQDGYWESAATVLEPGQTDWFHLAVAVTGNDYIKVYKDAVLQTANASYNGYVPISTSNFDASSILPETFFGCYNHHSANDTDHFQGKMDQMKIYTLRLEQSEIQDIYDIHAPAQPPPPPPPTMPTDYVYSNAGGTYNGTDEFTDTSETFNSELQGSYTITYKVHPDDGGPATAQGIFGNFNDPANYYWHALNTSGNIWIRQRTGNDQWLEINNETYFSDGPNATALHFAIAWEYNSHFKTYYNASMVASVNVAGASYYQDNHTASIDAYIALRNGDTSYFDGAITNIKVYDYMLNASEILAVYNNDY